MYAFILYVSNGYVYTQRPTPLCLLTGEGPVVLAHHVGRGALEERQVRAVVHDGRHHLIIYNVIFF